MITAAVLPYPEHAQQADHLRLGARAGPGHRAAGGARGRSGRGVGAAGRAAGGGPPTRRGCPPTSTKSSAAVPWVVNRLLWCQSPAAMARKTRDRGLARRLWGGVPLWGSWRAQSVQSGQRLRHGAPAQGAEARAAELLEARAKTRKAAERQAAEAAALQAGLRADAYALKVSYCSSTLYASLARAHRPSMHLPHLLLQQPKALTTPCSWSGHSWLCLSRPRSLVPASCLRQSKRVIGRGPGWWPGGAGGGAEGGCRAGEPGAQAEQPGGGGGRAREGGAGGRAARRGRGMTFLPCWW